MLEEYFAEMTAIVFKHNGIVDKYMGDGIVAFFENPSDVENLDVRKKCQKTL